MDASILSTFIEMTTPSGVTFNEHGVAQRGFRYTFKFRKLLVTLEVCALNGLWGGNFHIQTNLWGCGGPIMRIDFKFASFEECASYLWNSSKERIEKDKSNVSMEFLHFKVAMKKWFTLSPEEKFKQFKEVDFYAEIRLYERNVR